MVKTGCSSSNASFRPPGGYYLVFSPVYFTRLTARGQCRNNVGKKSGISQRKSYKQLLCWSISFIFQRQTHKLFQSNSNIKGGTFTGVMLLRDIQTILHCNYIKVSKNSKIVGNLLHIFLPEMSLAISK